MQLRAQRAVCDVSKLNSALPLGRVSAPRRGVARLHGRGAPARGASLRRVQAVADFGKVKTNEPREAILCQRFTAHASAISAALVLEDEEHRKQVITSSLDKTLALWSSSGDDCDNLCSAGFLEEARLSPGGSPIFCMVRDASPDGQPSTVFLGNHAKQVVSWVPPKPALEENVVLEGHCGWVRSLAASQGRWLFSAACNTLQQWDMSRAIPSLASSVTLERGDILCLAASKTRLYAGVADGSIHCWSIDKKSGALAEVGVRKKAHADRVTAIALRGNLLYSAAYDGALKAWDAASLEIVVGAHAAHDGGRVHCIAFGPDGHLYTGGDDQLVRRWQAGLLVPAAPPLFCHNHSVRALAAGGRDLLVSGDKGGEVAVWKV